MGDIDRGDSESVLDLLDDGSHLDPELCIEVRKRLVHEKDFRLDGQSSCQGYSLLLSSGELLRQAVCVFGDLHESHEGLCLLLYLVFRKLPVLESESYVLSYCEVRENGIVLEHHADVSLGWLEVVDETVPEIELAAFNRVESGNHPEQSRLSASGRSEECEELSGLDFQGKIRNGCEIAIFLYCIDYCDFDIHVNNSAESIDKYVLTLDVRA